MCVCVCGGGGGGLLKRCLLQKESNLERRFHAIKMVSIMIYRCIEYRYKEG